MKKNLVAILALVMAILMLAGCGSTPAPTEPASTEPAPTEPVVVAPNYVVPEGEPEVVLTFYADAEWKLSLYVDEANGKLFSLSDGTTSYYGVGWNVNEQGTTAMVGAIKSLAEGEKAPEWFSDEWAIVNEGIACPANYAELEAYVAEYGAATGPAAVIRVPGIAGEHYTYIDRDGNAWLLTVDQENKAFELNDGKISYSGKWFFHSQDDQTAVMDAEEIPSFFESDGHVNWALTENGTAIPQTDSAAADRKGPQVFVGSGNGNEFLYISTLGYGNWLVKADYDEKTYEMTDGTNVVTGKWFYHADNDQTAILGEGQTAPAFFEADGKVNFAVSRGYCAPWTDTGAMEALPILLTPGIEGVSYYYVDGDGITWLLTVDQENKVFEMNNGTDSISGKWFFHSQDDQTAIIENGTAPSWWNDDGHINWAIDGDVATPW